MARRCFVPALFIAVLLPACAPLNAAEEAPAFEAGPHVVPRGKGLLITFTASRPTDVAVSVRKGGRVVRHLAAGVIGAGAPPAAPLRKGLAQSLTWDGTDDLGRQVLGLPKGKAAGPAGCTVHVGLGLTPEFDRVLGWKGEAISGCISGLTVDDQGRLYVLNSTTKSPTTIRLLSHQGKYLKTIAPFPADLPHDKVRSLGFIELADRRVPIIRNPIHFTFYPELFGSATGYALPHQTMARVGERLVMTNAWYCSGACNVGPRRLLIVNTDGSIPKNYLGPLLGKGRQPGFVHMAPVPGEQAVFATGLTSTGDWKTAKPFHAVYKVPLDATGPPKVYLGEPDKAGRGAKQLNDPRGLAVDRHGNLYVSDWANNRIAVFTPGRRLLGEVAVTQPGPIALHQKTNALYVMIVSKRRFPNGGIKIQKLPPAVALDGTWAGGGAALAEQKLRYGEQIFAVDGTAEPTVLWIGSRFQTPALLRVEEKGGTFSRPTPTLPASDPAYHVGGFLAVDRDRDVVYVRRLLKPGGNGGRLARIDGKTGKATLMKLAAGDVAVDPQGNLIIVEGKHYQSRIARYDPSGKPLAFSGTGSHVLIEGSFLKGTFFASQHCPRGLCVAPNGDIYLLYPSHELSKKQRYLHCTVDVFGPDGKPKRKHAVWASNAAASVRADAAGNIYVADNVKPRGQRVPPELRGKTPKSRRSGSRQFNWYPWLYGSVVKFPPAGGAVQIPMAWGGYYRWMPLPEWKSPGSPAPKPVECTWGYGRKAHVQNAVRLYPGISPAPAPMGGCVCFGPRFDVDGFGRLFLPDTAQFCIRVVDHRGNLIRRIGSYGNADTVGSGTKVPFAWPQYVAVSREAVYVSDVINRRVVRIKLTYAAEKTVPVP